MRYESNIDRLAELVFLFYTATIGNGFSRIFRTLTSIEEKKMLCSSIVSRNNACCRVAFDEPDNFIFV